MRVSVLNYFRVALRGDSALAGDLADVITEINEDLGAGGGTFDNTAHALQVAIAQWMLTVAHAEQATPPAGNPTFAQMLIDVYQRNRHDLSHDRVSKLMDVKNRAGTGVYAQYLLDDDGDEFTRVEQ